MNYEQLEQENRDKYWSPKRQSTSHVKWENFAVIVWLSSIVLAMIAGYFH